MSYTVCSQGGVNISGDGSMDNFELKSSYKNSSNFLIFKGRIEIKCSFLSPYSALTTYFHTVIFYISLTSEKYKKILLNNKLIKHYKLVKNNRK